MKVNLPKIDAQFALYLVIVLAVIINLALVLGLGSTSESDKSESNAGKIIYLTTPDCPKCFALTPFTDYLTQAGIKSDQITEVSYQSLKGKWLLHKYKITQVPNVIFQDMSGTESYIKELNEAKVIAASGQAYILTNLQPPYLDLADQSRLRGEFTATYLTDATCTECYDINQHQGVFERLAMQPTQEKSHDINSDEGRALVDKYFITAVPTILLQGDLAVYQNLQQIWQGSGTIEEDGTYILRQGVASMGTYKQLPEGQIITKQE